MKRSIFTLVMAAVLVAAAQPAGAFSFLDKSYGTPQLGLSARSRAMGGAGVALDTGIYSLVDNPAALVLTPGTRVQFLGSVSRASENRLVPLFDTFDSYVTETAIAVNDNGYAEAEGGLVLDRWGGRGVRVAVGVFDRYDPRYDYKDERRGSASSNQDQVLDNRYLTTDGTLRAATLGAALPLGNGSSLGAAVNYYFGTFTSRDALVSRQDPSSSTATREKRSLDGWSVTLGALAHVDERINVGASIETRARLHDDYTQWVNDEVVSGASTNGDLNYPMRIQGGFTYRPRNTFKTTFAADVVYMPWSDLEDHLNPNLKLYDTWEARFGLEHVFYNGLPGRIGFRYGQDYAIDQSEHVFFTVGVGYAVNKIKLDVSGEVGKRSSRQDPIRSREGLAGFGIGYGQDRVEDTLARVFVGVDYGL